MTTYGIEISGDKEVEARLQLLGDQANRKVAEALYLEANNVFNESQRLVPVDTGTLKSSGTIVGPDIFGDQVSVTIGYGGAAASYAIYVHEIIERNGNPVYHRPPTQAKFLEAPMLANLSGLPERLKARLLS